MASGKQIICSPPQRGSREGQDDGTSQYFRTLLVQTGSDALEDVELDHTRLDLLGGPQTLPHYPMGWAMASNTPFRLYKINTHQGGHQVPFIVHWPAGLTDTSAAEPPAEGQGEIRTQYQHITDLLPTLAELTGLEVPTRKHGQPVPQPAGASFAASLTDPECDSTHREQYYEMIGHRGMYRDGWSAVSLRIPRSFAEPPGVANLSKTRPGEAVARSTPKARRSAGASSGALGQPGLPPRRGNA